MSIQEIQKYSKKDFTRHFVGSNNVVEFYLDEVITDTGTRYFVHVKILKRHRWTKKDYTDCMYDLIEVEEALSDKGLTHLYSVVMNEKPYLHFSSIFGYIPIQAVTKEGEERVHGWVMEKRI